MFYVKGNFVDLSLGNRQKMASLLACIGILKCGDYFAYLSSLSVFKRNQCAVLFHCAILIVTDIVHFYAAYIPKINEYEKYPMSYSNLFNLIDVFVLYLYF